MKEEKNNERTGEEREKDSADGYLDYVDGKSDEMQDLLYWSHPFWHKTREKFQKLGDILRRRKKIAVLIAAVLLIAGYLIYNNMREFKSYAVLSTSERTDVSSTNFVEMDGKIVKYSSDGVSYMDKDKTIWSAAYSIQIPVIDTCESMIVVGEQDGSQIYIYDAEQGQIGNFQTLLPIKKVKVASQGVVAAVLEEGEVTWINLYDTSGNEIAKNRTTVGESGYPLDISISPDGEKMIISFLRITNGVVNTKIAFYNFGTVGKSNTNNEVNSEIYENTIVPKVEYLSNTQAVAFRDNGFSVFAGRQIPEIQAEIEFSQDIISVFYDEDTLGFVFQSDLSDYRYKIQLYNLKGGQIMEKYIDEEFRNIKLSSGELLLYHTNTFSIYSLHGRKIFSGEYNATITDVIKISGFRRYLVITEDAMEQIKLK